MTFTSRRCDTIAGPSMGLRPRPVRDPTAGCGGTSPTRGRRLTCLRGTRALAIVSLAVSASAQAARRRDGPGGV